MSARHRSEWFVDILERGTNELVRTITCKSESHADSVQRGVDINLDHEKFHTVVSFSVPMVNA